MKALVEAKQAREAKKQEMGRVFEKKSHTAGACDEESNTGTPVPRYHIYQSFLMALDDRLNGIVREIRSDDRRVKQKEGLLKKETVRRKTLEHFKEVVAKEYYDTMNKEEQNALDELAILRRGLNK